MKNIEVVFGALAPRISEQLDAGGFRYSTESAISWQRDAEAIVRLSVRGLLADSESHKARKRLMKDIVAGVRQPKENAS